MPNNHKINGNELNPKQHIGKIQSDYLNNSERILKALEGAIERLQNAFPSHGHFLMEFIQNADGAKSKSIKIEINKDVIKIFNDGKCFSLEDVDSICYVGYSSKTSEDYIGYLGVGFKSVFLISECPKIYSGNYRFKFDKNHWRNSDSIPWQVIPIWVENIEEIKVGDKVTVHDKGLGEVQLIQPIDSDEYRVQIFIKESGETVRDTYTKSEITGMIENVYTSETKFVLPIAKEIDERTMKKLEEEISTLNNRVILFLQNIKKIELHDKINNIKRTIVAKPEDRTTFKPNYDICFVEESENGKLKVRDKWLIFHSGCIVPNEVKEDSMTIAWERQNVTKREVLAIFRLDEKDNLLKEEKGTAYTGAFSFTPLKETKTGLKFNFQADFLTTPGRADIQREAIWNEWLAREVYKLIEEKCISEFLKNEKWKLNFTKVLYPESGGHELLDTYIKKPLESYLKNNSVLIAEDDSHAKPNELISIEPEVRELLTMEDLQKLYPNKKVIHSQCEYPPDIYSPMPLDIFKFVTHTETKEFMIEKAKLKDVEWFKKLYSAFTIKYTLEYFSRKYSRYKKEHDEFWNNLHYQLPSIVLTDKNELAKVTECYINPKNLGIPEEMRDNLKIVHPDLVEDKNFQKFREKLNEERYHPIPPEKRGIIELTEEVIKNFEEISDEIKTTKEKWGSMTDQEKISKIKSFKDLWKYKKESLIQQLGFLTLKTKSGRWLNPDEIIFPKEYTPDHRLETIIEEGLLDFSDIEFLSTEFIEEQEYDEVKQWYDFFKEVGVDGKIEKEKDNIAERVAILTALRFESEKKRKAHALAESEMGKPGYDILSKYQEDNNDKEIYIEVKGGRETKPEKMLTKNQTITLMQEKERYFVYIVGDALNNPTLYVIRGDKILAEEEFRMPIRSSKLEELKEEKFQPLLEEL